MQKKKKTEGFQKYLARYEQMFSFEMIFGYPAMSLPGPHLQKSGWEMGFGHQGNLVCLSCSHS